MRGKLIITAAILCFWLAADVVPVDAATSFASPSTTAGEPFNSSANDSMQASSSPPPDITSHLSSSSSSPTTAIASSSSVSLSSVSSSVVSGVSMAATSAPLSPTQKAPVTNALGTSPNEQQSKKPPTDPTYIPMIAAIISGFALLVVMAILLLAMAVVYRHINKKEPMMTPPRKPKKADGALYAIPESQSAQYLVSSMSTPSFGNSPSDARLDAHLPSSPNNMVYYNRGNDVDHRPAGAYDHEDGYRPIQIVAADAPGRPQSMTKV